MPAPVAPRRHGCASVTSTAPATRAGHSTVAAMSDATYVEHTPPADLAADVVCTWTGRVGTSGVPYTDRVLPDGCVDLIWTDGRLMVAGPDTGPVPLTPRPDTTYVGIRFVPGHAPAALGVPASALRDLRPDLADLWGDRAARAVTGRFAGLDTSEGGGCEAAEHVLAQVVRGRIAEAPPADRVVTGLVALLRDRAPTGPGLVATVSRELGVTERSLHRRCTAAVGYGPKTLDRVLRFRRALALAGTAHLRPGLIAAAAGYADQAHLTRECRRLAGQTPSELFKTAG